MLHEIHSDLPVLNSTVVGADYNLALHKKLTNSSKGMEKSIQTQTLMYSPDANNKSLTDEALIRAIRHILRD